VCQLGFNVQKSHLLVLFDDVHHFGQVSNAADVEYGVQTLLLEVGCKHVHVLCRRVHRTSLHVELVGAATWQANCLLLESAYTWQTHCGVKGSATVASAAMPGGFTANIGLAVVGSDAAHVKFGYYGSGTLGGGYAGGTTRSASNNISGTCFRLGKADAESFKVGFRDIPCGRGRRRQKKIDFHTGIKS